MCIYIYTVHIGLLVVSNHPQLKVYCWVYRHYHGMYNQHNWEYDENRYFNWD